MDYPQKQIKLSGEAAEAFDHQNDTDIALLKESEDFVAFRPLIEGEFDQERSFGLTRNFIASDYEVPGGDWVCVIDVFQALGITNKYSGCRMRIPCPAPINTKYRAELRRLAIKLVKQEIKSLQKWAKKNPRGFK